MENHFKSKWLEDAQQNQWFPWLPMITAEYTLRYVVDYKKEGLQNYIVF
jgi:hypothetical protein